MARIYHITHVDNLPGIVAAGGLFSDADDRVGDHVCTEVGMSAIKRRRLGLAVSSQPGTMVGEYVPFYFCPRSVMLFLLHRRNHPDLSYRGGQAPILHLTAQVSDVIDWAVESGTPWAFSFSNAGAFYTRFSSSRNDLRRLDWNAIRATDFRDRDVKEAKQAEFLVHAFFPFTLVDEIGVFSAGVESRVRAILAGGGHCPSVRIRRQWYY